MSRVQGTSERLRHRVTALRHHLLREPFHVVFPLDDPFEVAKRFGHRVGSPPTHLALKRHGWQMPARIVVKLFELLCQLFGRGLIGLFGASHFHALLIFAGKLNFGRSCHDAPQPKRLGGDV